MSNLYQIVRSDGYENELYYRTVEEAEEAIELREKLSNYKWTWEIKVIPILFAD